MTNAQIDKLGERLRLEPASEADLGLLNAYRGSFEPSYQEVMWVLREKGRGHLEPTGRFPKTPGSIVAKLVREPSIRLSQIQDIAGCRLIVPNLERQLVAQMMVESLFDISATRVIDRRERPSHGYRAIHIIVTVRGRVVEIQLRTALQHLWAELCEKLADKFGGDVKYGGGSEQIRRLLSSSSQRVAEIEQLEQKLFQLDANVDDMKPDDAAIFGSRSSQIHEQVERDRADLIAKLRKSMALVQRVKLDRGVH